MARPLAVAVIVREADLASCLRLLLEPLERRDVAPPVDRLELVQQAGDLVVERACELLRVPRELGPSVRRVERQIPRESPLRDLTKLFVVEEVVEGRLALRSLARDQAAERRILHPERDHADADR